MHSCVLYIGNVMPSDNLKLIELPSTDELAPNREAFLQQT